MPQLQIVRFIFCWARWV